MSPVCVLVGPPGSGKTTVGTALAHRLGVGFRDTDHDVEVVAGKPIPDVFFEEGEAAFRQYERAAVVRALAEHDGVLALGGGAVLDPRTRDDLLGYYVIALAVSLHAATKRVGWGAGRPMLDLNPRARLAELMAARRPYYDEVANVTVDTDDRDPDDVAAEVVRLLEAEA